MFQILLSHLFMESALSCSALLWQKEASDKSDRSSIKEQNVSVISTDVNEIS